MADNKLIIVIVFIILSGKAIFADSKHGNECFTVSEIKLMQSEYAEKNVCVTGYYEAGEFGEYLRSEDDKFKIGVDYANYYDDLVRGTIKNGLIFKLWKIQTDIQNLPWRCLLDDPLLYDSNIENDEILCTAINYKVNLEGVIKIHKSPKMFDRTPWPVEIVIGKVKSIEEIKTKKKYEELNP